MFIFWKKRNTTSFFIHSAMQSHCSSRSSIYGGVWWWCITCSKMAASLEIHQRNVKKSNYPTNLVCPKGDLKNLLSHILHIFILCISVFLFYLHFLQSHIFISPYHNALIHSCFMARWKAGTNFPLQFLVGVCSLKSAKSSSFQQHWLIQFQCISFPCMNCITNMQKVSSLEQGILTEHFNSFLCFASKWQNCCWCITS